MASVDYAALAQNILAKVGGPENVRSVVHCATRLRFSLVDRDKADSDAISKMPGVITVVDSGGQMQVVIGNNVAKAYDALPENLRANSNEESEGGSGEKKSPLNALIDIVSAIFAPALGAMAGAGILKGLVILFAAIGWLESTSTTYAILYAAGDAIFMFLPVLLAVTAARKFKANVYTAMVIAFALLYTSLQTSTFILDGEETTMSLMAFADAGGRVTFFGIPVVMQAYTSTVLPILFAVWIQGYVERFANKIFHEAIRNFLTPMVSLVVMVPLTLITIGPIAVLLGDGIAAGLLVVYSVSPIVTAVLLAVLWQVIVIFGVHWSLVPVFMMNVATMGYDPLSAALYPAVLAQAGAAFGIFLRIKNPQKKSIAGSAAVAGIFGITEPAIYGVTLPRKRAFAMGLVGAAIGGGIIGAAKAYIYVPALVSLLTLTGGIDPSGEANTVIFLVLGTAVGWGVAVVLSYFFGITKEDLEEIKAAKNGETFESTEEAGLNVPAGTIVAPVSGTVIALSEVNDPVFSSGKMGAGCAITPTDGRVVAPVSGVLKVVAQSGHAYGIRTDEGADVLVHFGIDTVALRGEGFAVKVTKGARVNAGDILAEVDLNTMKEKNIDTTTVVAVTNQDKFDVHRSAEGPVENSTPIMTIEAKAPAAAN
ncbi:MAG: beta-glucoside-specific PTS transporter subunit IIABC [Corynebacterium sp.]|nr:beta-glucoside-specific PTS transporter subunit IIABC [Corynebacterium sp.]